MKEKILTFHIPVEGENAACDRLAEKLRNLADRGYFCKKITCHRLPLWHKMSGDNRAHHFYLTIQPADMPERGNVYLIFNRSDAEFEKEKNELLAEIPQAKEVFIYCTGTPGNTGRLGVGYY
ncbi:MAG: hypothetical protein DU429_07495 [Candidatus Tokpelaia sp.]|nr:MAG: hypothetical protein DU430_08895 [Candidatus Tokpelaia sp.]KAA6205754.1 MAG: hypothetical protein DU429_07495 [Candidatus Tokpelaia sp.]